MDGSRPRKYEFDLLVGLIGVLAVILLGALERAREDVEDAAVQAEIAALRVELLDWLAHREAWGGKLPESRNPLRWVARQPAGYLGELDTPPEQGGVWYFDRSRQELAYRFRSGREARFRLARGLESAGAAGRLAGVALRRVDDARE